MVVKVSTCDIQKRHQINKSFTRLSSFYSTISVVKDFMLLASKVISVKFASCWLKNDLLPTYIYLL